MVALELFITVPFILTFFLRKLLVKLYIRKIHYPGVFYSVLDKLGLIKNLEIYLSDELLNDMYKPMYSTNQFLRDNNLKSEIGTNKIKTPFLVIVFGVVIIVFYFLGERFKLNDNPIFEVAYFLFIAMNIYFWIKGKRQQNDDDPILFFKESGLGLPNFNLIWNDIYDWRYQQGGKSESPKIFIYYYNADKIQHELMVDLSNYNIDKIDFLLLLTHFKGKYG